jgi:peptidyl-prolyl cis-trans isomerase SurA
MRRALVAFLLASSPAFAAGKVVDRIVAVVNEEIILETEVEQIAATQLRGPADLESKSKEWEALKRKALDHMIDKKLIGQQAHDLKLSVTSEEVDRALKSVQEQNKLDEATFAEALKQQGFTLESYRRSLKQQILELKVINTAVRSRIQITDDEVKAYYNQNARQMGDKSTSHLKTLQVDVPDGGNAEEKKKLAERLLSEARKGKTFESLAKENAAAGVTADDLGWVGPGTLQDALEAEVSQMEAGDVRGPIRTARGWHLLRVEEKKGSSNIRSLDEAKEQIRRTLYDQQVEKATGAWLKELRKKAHVDNRM